VGCGIIGGILDGFLNQLQTFAYFGLEKIHAGKTAAKITKSLTIIVNFSLH
jgi:hypothetical protein